MKKNDEHKPVDLMNVMNIKDVSEEVNKLIEKGKNDRVQILIGTENPNRLGHIPYAHTSVSIVFGNEEALRQCVKMLQWSDERLRALPEQLILWSWDKTYREGMTIKFGVNWYDRTFFEKRKDAFLEPEHANYYLSFGAKPEDFLVKHFVEGDPGFEDEVAHHRAPN